MIKKFLFILCICFFYGSTSWATVKSESEQRADWENWLDVLKEEMIESGISKKTIKRAYQKDYFHLIKEVVIQDNKQPEFLMSSPKYINRIINKNKVHIAREKYKELSPKYSNLTDKYGVPLNYLVAFWGVETHFGYNKGKYHLVDGLTNLSYKNRRAKFFKNELFNVLKIMDKYNLEGDKMMGSWAGAMGHFQFMPSTYNAYAVDYDEDGIIDIWDNFGDAIASAANYLSKLGWKVDEPWGQEVKLPWNFNYKLVGPKKLKTVCEWEKIGIYSANGKGIKLPNDALAAVTLPDGKSGHAYLTLSNFRRIMIWNRSTNYALAVSILSDYIRSNQTYRPISDLKMTPLTNKDIELIQKFSNNVLHTKLKVDGRIGSKTTHAVKRLQHKWKLSEDGIPDQKLLKKIKQYKSKASFMVPVQKRKPAY